MLGSSLRNTYTYITGTPYIHIYKKYTPELNSPTDIIEKNESKRCVCTRPDFVNCKSWQKFEFNLSSGLGQNEFPK